MPKVSLQPSYSHQCRKQRTCRIWTLAAADARGW